MDLKVYSSTQYGDARTEVVREMDGVRITIPTPRSHPIAYLFALIPVGFALASAEQRVRTSSGTGSAPVEIGPRTQWLLTTLTRFAKGHGITIKTRQGLTTVGKGLGDDETRYVHAIIRRALAG